MAILLLILVILPATFTLPIDTNSTTNQHESQNDQNVTWEFPVNAPPPGKSPDLTDPTSWSSHLLGAEPKSAVQHQILDFPLLGNKDAENPSGSPQMIIDLPGSLVPNSLNFPFNGGVNPPNPFGSSQQVVGPSESVMRDPNNQNSSDSSHQIIDLSSFVLPNPVNFPASGNPDPQTPFASPQQASGQQNSSTSFKKPIDLSGSVMTGPIDLQIPGSTGAQIPDRPSQQTINLSKSTSPDIMDFPFDGNPDSQHSFEPPQDVLGPIDALNKSVPSHSTIDLSGNVIPGSVDFTSPFNSDFLPPPGSSPQVVDVSRSAMPVSMTFPSNGNTDSLDPFGLSEQNPLSNNNQSSSSSPKVVDLSGFVLPDPIDFPVTGNIGTQNPQVPPQQLDDIPESVVPSDGGFPWGGSVNPIDGSSSSSSDPIQNIASVNPSDVVPIIPADIPSPITSGQSNQNTPTQLTDSTQILDGQVNTANELPPNPFDLQTDVGSGVDVVNQQTSIDAMDPASGSAVDTLGPDENLPTNVFPRVVQNSNPFDTGGAIDITAKNLDSAQAHFIDFWLQNPEAMLTDFEGPAFGPPLPVVPDIPKPITTTIGTPPVVPSGTTDVDHSQSGAQQDSHGHEGHDHAHGAESGNCGGVVRDSTGRITHIIDTHDCSRLEVIDSHITGGHAIDPHNGELLLALNAKSLADKGQTTSNQLPGVTTSTSSPISTSPGAVSGAPSDLTSQPQTDLSGLTVAELKEQLRLAKINARKEQLLEKKKIMQAKQKERQLARKKAREEQARRRQEARQAQLQKRLAMQKERKQKRQEAKRLAMERAKARREQRAKKRQEMKRKRQQMRKRQQQKKQTQAQAEKRAARRKRQRQQKRKTRAKANHQRNAQTQAKSNKNSQISKSPEDVPVEKVGQHTSSVFDFLEQRRLEKQKRLRHYAG